MKQILSFSVTLLLFVVSTAAFASDFGYDAQKVKNEFASLKAAEEYVAVHDVNITELKASGVVSSDVVIKAWNPDDDPLMGISPFLWGCCLGVLGIVLVYVLTDGDKDMVKKSVIGCVVGTGTWVVFWFLWNLLWATAVY